MSEKKSFTTKLHEVCANLLPMADSLSEYYIEPDGYGTKYPVIEFKGCKVVWYYGERGKNIRDIQYQEILSLFKERDHKF